MITAGTVWPLGAMITAGTLRPLLGGDDNYKKCMAFAMRYFIGFSTFSMFSMVTFL